MFRCYGVLGITLIIVSYILRASGSLILITETFVIGYWLFFDAIDFMISGTSLIHKIKKKHSLMPILVITGIFIGILFEIFGVMISNLWAYTNFTIFFYVDGIIFGYGFPILMYYSAYRVVLHLVRNKFGKFGKKLVSRNEETLFFSVLSYVGIACTLVPLLIIPYLDLLDPVPRGMLFGLTLVGIWFLLESIEYKQHKRSLIKDVFEGYWNPAVAIVIAAIMTGISWELFNTVDFAWKYQNLPFNDTTVLGVPIAVIIGWIPLLIIYLSFYRVISKSKKAVF